MGKPEKIEPKTSFIDRFEHNNEAPPKGSKKTSFIDRFPMNQPGDETEMPEDRVSTKKTPFVQRHETASSTPKHETVPIPAEDFEEYLAFKRAQTQTDKE